VQTAEDNVPASAPGIDELRVLYFFGGDERRGDVRGALLDLIKKDNLNLKLCMDEVDLVRQPGLDECDGKVQKLYCSSVISGRWDVILLSPALGSFSRAIFASHTPSVPLRDAAWPHGFPWLEFAKADLVRSENEILNFCVKILEFAKEASRRTWWHRTRGWMEHPEDLGKHHLGDPASVWQLPAVKHLSAAGYKRSAFFHCAFDDCGYSRPSGCLSSIPEWNKSPKVYSGWPKFGRSSSSSCRSTVTDSPATNFFPSRK
jgi:hypothetical protein